MTTPTKALKLAREGVEIHSPNSPEYIVCAALIEALAQPEQEPVAYDGTATEAGARYQSDQHLRALLRYTENFYGVAIKHGMKAGETANAIAHIEKAGKALHELVHAWAGVAETRATPPRQTMNDAVAQLKARHLAIIRANNKE